MLKPPIKTHQDLEAYRVAFDGSMRVFERAKGFPAEERYSLTDRFRRSSRSVCANLAEAWRKRRHKAAFLAKRNDCKAKTAETQVWIEFSVKCGYLDTDAGRELYETYDQILGSLVRMIKTPDKWLL